MAMKQSRFDFDDNDKVQTSFHNFDENREIVGILKEVQEGTYGEQYLLETQDNKIVTVGSYTALKGKFKDAVGKPVKIVYLGEVKSEESNRTYKNFDVFIKK